VTAPTPLPCRRCHLRLASCRGLCPACYKALSLAVKSSAATWEGLEVAGLALAPQKAGAAWKRGFCLGTGDTRLITTEGPAP
jgi:hypothetical protein